MATKPDPVSVGTHTVVGAVIGAVAVGAAVAAAPVVLPALGLAALGTTAVAVVGGIPWLGAAIGGYFGYKNGKAAQADQ